MSSIKDLKCMCANTPCRDCRLLSWCESRDRISELPDDMDEIVDKYVSKHRPKTYAMDFLGKFPNAQVDRYKTPKVCRVVIYGNICPKECHIVSSCADCWNMEMTEQ